MRFSCIKKISKFSCMKNEIFLYEKFSKFSCMENEIFLYGKIIEIFLYEK
jgi:hypothetical protein